MNKKIIFFLFLIFLGCKSNNYLTVENILKVAEPVSDMGIIYNLPKTKVLVAVKIKRIVKSKGPYEEYCNKYLGDISDIIRKNETNWLISDVRFETFPEKDPDNIYVLSSKSAYFPLILTKEGFLVSYNDDVDYKNEEFSLVKKTMKHNTTGEKSFFILPADKNYKIVYDTVYKEEIYDTIIKKVPILRSNMVRKSTEEQAKELADKIITLKDDRAALLVGEGDNDYLPEGAALNIMLKEIDKLEQEYMKMFVGVVDTLTYTYYFTFEPTKEDVDKKIVLFKFSENSGILQADNIYGTPVYIQISSDKTTTSVDQFLELQRAYQTESNKVAKGLFYRIPAKATITLTKEDQLLAEKNVDIAQLGEIAFLPAEMFKYDNLKIDFYPDLGAIKKIEYNRQ